MPNHHVGPRLIVNRSRDGDLETHLDLAPKSPRAAAGNGRHPVMVHLSYKTARIGREWTQRVRGVDPVYKKVEQVNQMNDDDQSLTFCVDLVTVKTGEPFLLNLFERHPMGKWCRVREMCEELGIPASAVKPDVVTVWLDDPFGDEGYAVIVFFDDDTKQSFAANYNKRRLLNGDQLRPA